MEEFGYTQCPRDHAVFCTGTWRMNAWAVCVFWVDEETGIGSRQQLDRVDEMLHRNYGLSGEGDPR